MLFVVFVYIICFKNIENVFSLKHARATNFSLLFVCFSSKWIDVIVLGSGSKFLMDMKAKRFEQNRPLQTTDAGEELTNTPASTSLASKTSTQVATNHFSNTDTQSTFQSHLLAPPECHPIFPPLASVLTPTSVEPTIDETQKAYDEFKVSIYPLYLFSLNKGLIKNESI